MNTFTNGLIALYTAFMRLHGAMTKKDRIAKNKLKTLSLGVMSHKSVKRAKMKNDQNPILSQKKRNKSKPNKHKF